jgi:hypothetical protein
MAAVDQAQRFLENEVHIIAACAEPGPFIYAVYADRIERIFPA